ncbi:recombinase family protein [Burkholderia sp. B21-005]|uniref:recombinase family protein n=1 Tax=Burkholderia sp. B21-005 TaxID=2890406 RepID=UPI001E549C69|nr:recombinase family protein [Burkholderia sp. B21-005]UEP42169.1 recombinase family protein [Burkholderia sp. B21-005]
MTQPLVISYIRFSTAKQAGGTSLARQTLLARNWCARRGWTLDENLTLHDLGISGFNQDNTSKGALAGFLQAVSDKRIPAGTYLLIENLDRLTRADLPTAVMLLLGIAEAGITCVTLQDEQEWTKERLSNPADFMYSLMLLHRGHDESKVKSKRIRAVHDKARAERDRSVFGRAPGWLRRTADKNSWEAIPELVGIVETVFDLVAGGYGGVAIARRANAEGWPLPSLSGQEKGTKWNTTYPNKLIRNRAVLGELEPCLYRNGKSVPTGEVVKDWYPRIISDDLFFRANAAIDARRAKPPRRDKGYRNIFQGVIFCGRCGATLARKAKSGGKNSKWYAQYVCSDRHRGVSKCPSVNAQELETPLIHILFNYFSEHLGNDERLARLRNELVAIEGKIEATRVKSQRLAEAIEQSELPLSTLVKRLEECERELPPLETHAQSLRAQLKSASSIPDDYADSQSVLDALRGEEEESERIRAEAHTKMLMALDSLWIWPREMVAVRLKGATSAIALPLPDPDAKPISRELEDGETVDTFPMGSRLKLALQGQLPLPTPRRGSTPKIA